MQSKTAATWGRVFAGITAVLVLVAPSILTYIGLNDSKSTLVAGAVASGLVPVSAFLTVLFLRYLLRRRLIFPSMTQMVSVLVRLNADD